MGKVKKRNHRQRFHMNTFHANDARWRQGPPSTGQVDISRDRISSRDEDCCPFQSAEGQQLFSLNMFLTWIPWRNLTSVSLSLYFHVFCPPIERVFLCISFFFLFIWRLTRRSAIKYRETEYPFFLLRTFFYMAQWYSTLEGNLWPKRLCTRCTELFDLTRQTLGISLSLSPSRQYLLVSFHRYVSDLPDLRGESRSRHTPLSRQQRIPTKANIYIYLCRYMYTRNGFTINNLCCRFARKTASQW